MTDEERLPENEPKTAEEVEAEVAEVIAEETEQAPENAGETPVEEPENIEETEKIGETIMEKTTVLPGARRVYQGTESERTGLVRKVVIFAAVCAVCACAAFVLGMNGPEKHFYYLVFAVAEAIVSVAVAALAVVLAVQKGNMRESLYRATVAAIPGVCVALILCNALTVIAALVHLGRTGVDESRIVFLLISLVLRLICMESAHLCRKTVTGSVWAISWGSPEL